MMKFSGHWSIDAAEHWECAWNRPLWESHYECGHKIIKALCGVNLADVVYDEECDPCNRLMIMIELAQ